MLDYKSLTSLDMPEVDVALIEDPDPNCPYGAKEVGRQPRRAVLEYPNRLALDVVPERLPLEFLVPDVCPLEEGHHQPLRLEQACWPR